MKTARMKALSFCTLLLVIAIFVTSEMVDAYGRNCDSLDPVPVHRGRPFYFGSFPPAAREEYKNYERPVSYVPSEECTWVFESAGNCTLEFRSYTFERGDVDCREQHFIVGDETKEEKFCGFRAPNRFRSEGKQLFLTHYQRNGNKVTRTSYIGGEIHCVKVRPPKIECPIPTTDCVTLNEFSVPAAAGVGGLTGVTILNSGDFPPSITATQKCEGTDGGPPCTQVGVICLTLRDTTPPCNTIGNPFPEKDPDGHCVRNAGDCPAKGPCDVQTFTQAAGAGPAMDHRKLHCSATAEQMCVVGAVLCSSAAPRGP